MTTHYTIEMQKPNEEDFYVYRMFDEKEKAIEALGSMLEDELFQGRNARIIKEEREKTLIASAHAIGE